MVPSVLQMASVDLPANVHLDSAVNDAKIVSDHIGDNSYTM